MRRPGDDGYEIGVRTDTAGSIYVLRRDAGAKLDPAVKLRETETADDERNVSSECILFLDANETEADVFIRASLMPLKAEFPGGRIICQMSPRLLMATCLLDCGQYRLLQTVLRRTPLQREWKEAGKKVAQT